MKQCSSCNLLFRAKVHKCPKCGSYAVYPIGSDASSKAGSKADSEQDEGAARVDPTRTKTKPRLSGYIVPQTPTPLQGEKAISKEMLAKLRQASPPAGGAPSNDRPIDRKEAFERLDDAMGDIGTDTTVEIPNPLAAGLEFSSDVFLEDRVDPSIERPLHELRRDPSVEKKLPALPKPGLDVDTDAFGKVPTRPGVQGPGDEPKAQAPAKRAADSEPPRLPPPAPITSPQEQLAIEEEILTQALDGLDLSPRDPAMREHSLRDPEAGLADPSLILDLNEALTEEDIELAGSIVTGEREVRSTPRFESVHHARKIELAPDLQESSDALAPPPSPAQHGDQTGARPEPTRSTEQPPQTTQARAQAAYTPPRIGSRLTGIAAVLAFGGAAALALSASSTAVGGWMAIFAAGVVALGAIRKDLGWKHELLHVIAAGAAVAAAQPWALDLAEISQVSFWRAPAAMTCVGALVVGLTLGLLAIERSAPTTSAR